MAIRPCNNHRHLSQICQEKAEEREIWYRLVVRIIKWKEGLGGDKISTADWDTYCDRIIKISITNGKERTLENLRETQRIIQNRGGFE